MRWEKNRIFSSDSDETNKKRKSNLLSEQNEKIWRWMNFKDKCDVSENGEIRSLAKLTLELFVKAKLSLFVMMVQSDDTVDTIFFHESNFFLSWVAMKKAHLERKQLLFAVVVRWQEDKTNFRCINVNLINESRCFSSRSMSTGVSNQIFDQNESLEDDSNDVIRRINDRKVIHWKRFSLSFFWRKKNQYELRKYWQNSFNLKSNRFNNSKWKHWGKSHCSTVTKVFFDEFFSNRFHWRYANNFLVRSEDVSTIDGLNKQK